MLLPPKVVLLFFLKIGVLFLCRYLIEVPPSSLFEKQWMIHLIQGVSFFFIINIILSIISFFAISIYTVNKKNENLDNNFVLGISRIVTMLNVVTGVISLMIITSINPLRFITSISIVAAALALLSKDYFTNMINGLIIMFSDKWSLGDYIVVDKTKGRIIDITFINVVLQDDEGDIHYVPNTTMLNNIVINHSHLFFKKVYFEFNIPNIIGIEFDTIYHHLEKELSPYVSLIEPGSFQVKPREIEKEYVKYRIIFYMHHKDIRHEREIKNALLQSIIKLITKNYKEFIKHVEH